MVDATINLDAVAAAGLSQSDLARHLGVRPSTVSMKVLGHRPWKLDEINQVLDLLREKNPAITYEQLFGADRHGVAA